MLITCWANGHIIQSTFKECSETAVSSGLTLFFYFSLELNQVVKLLNKGGIGFFSRIYQKKSFEENANWKIL